MEPISRQKMELEANLLPLCLSAVQTTIHELKTLAAVNRLPEIEKLDPTYSSLEELYGDNTADITQYLNLDPSQHDMHCFQKVLSTLKSVLEETLDEVGIEKLQERVAGLEKMRADEEQLLRDTKDTYGRIAEAEVGLEQSCEEWFRAVRDGEENVGIVKDDFKNLQHEYRLKENYIAKWMDSRLEQLKVELEQKKNEVQSTIRSTRNEIERERRIHKEISAYIELVIEDHQKAIVYWKQKYKDDMKAMEEKLAEVKNNRIKQYLKRTALSALYKERAGEMQAYREYKEEQRLKEEELRRLNATATTIQAWWRGVMVRRNLGPYKVKKPKSKGKADKRNK